MPNPTAQTRLPAAGGWAESGKERIAWALWRTAVILLCAAAAVLSEFFPLEKRYAPPVIHGVQEKMELYADDDIPAALLAGVTATGAQDRPDETFPVTVSAFAESGEAVQEYLPGTYRLVYTCGDGAGREAEPVESVLTVLPADTQGPVFAGLRDWTVTAGETVSYREGVTATDNVDGAVTFQVNAEQVDLAQAGEYTATYRAADSRGNETAVTIHITVLEPEPPDEEIVAGDGSSYGITKSGLDAQADALLAQITTPDMTPRRKAWAIYSYVGGGSDHYWQLVQIDGGWYHFDACPHPNGYPLTSFLLTEAEVRAYSAQFSGFYANYYTYDYAACPVVVVGTPGEELPEEPPGEEEHVEYPAGETETEIPEEQPQQPAEEEHVEDPAGETQAEIPKELPQQIEDEAPAHSDDEP